MEAIRVSFRLSILGEDERISDIDTKKDRFFMVSCHSLITGGLRFLINDFFVDVLREIGVARG